MDDHFNELQTTSCISNLLLTPESFQVWTLCGPVMESAKVLLDVVAMGRFILLVTARDQEPWVRGNRDELWL